MKPLDKWKVLLTESVIVHPIPCDILQDFPEEKANVDEDLLPLRREECYNVPAFLIAVHSVDQILIGMHQWHWSGLQEEEESLCSCVWISSCKEDFVRTRKRKMRRETYEKHRHSMNPTNPESQQYLPIS